MKFSTLLGFTCVLSFLTAPLHVSAGESPGLGTRPITIFIPLAPGGSVDVEARLYAKAISGNLLPQQILVDFKPGASGTIAAAFIARSAPDGHTLQTITTSFTAFPAHFKDFPFDTIRDFTHISQVSKKYFVFAANPSAPVKTFAEYIAYAKANPEKLNVATNGAGGSAHLALAWLNNLTNTKTTFIHYKGLGPAVADLVAGRVDVSLIALQSTVSMVKAGKIRPLAMMGSSRTDLIPGLPTIGESVPGYTFESYTGISGPAGIPAGVLKQLNDAFSKVIKVPEVIKAFNADGSIGVGSSPAEFTKLLQTETERWKKVARDNNIRLEE